MSSIRTLLSAIPLTFSVVVAATVCTAQEQDAQPWDTIRQVATHIGEMSASAPTGDTEVFGDVTFEPYQGWDDMFRRDDVVFLMRHGPTDWSRRDVAGVDPTDCENQRIMTQTGENDMVGFARTLAYNEIVPSQIVVSEWCRNQQTLDALLQGYEDIAPEAIDGVEVITEPGVNLLLSLNGAPDVTHLQDTISNWDGHPDRSGPLLIVSHYTNIERLTSFRVLEGEILILDPKRDNRVLGFVRLEKATPDEGHFTDVLSSPLIPDDRALQMMRRYYEALGNRDLEELDELLADGWVTRGLSEGEQTQGVDGFIEGVRTVTRGLDDTRFVVEDIHVADRVITVIGRITGTHSGTIFDIEPTGRDVNFGAIAVHRLDEGQIVESWQMADRVGLIQQISD